MIFAVPTLLSKKAKPKYIPAVKLISIQINTIEMELSILIKNARSSGSMIW